MGSSNLSGPFVSTIAAVVVAEVAAVVGVPVLVLFVVVVVMVLTDPSVNHQGVAR